MKWLALQHGPSLPISSVPGEEVLQQFQMSREESQRLKDIEEKLAAIQNEKNKEAEIQVSYLVSTSRRVF